MLVEIEGKYELAQDAEKEIALLENEIKKLKEKEDEMKAKILEEMEKHNVIKIDTDVITISYVAPTYRESFDSKKFKEEHQDLYDEYIKMSDVKSSIRIKVKDGNMED
jgi:hypothetical protein